MSNEKKVYLLTGHTHPNEDNVLFASLSETSIQNLLKRFQQLKDEMPELPSDVNPLRDDDRMVEYFRKQREWYGGITGFKPSLHDLITWDSYYIEIVDLI